MKTRYSASEEVTGRKLNKQKKKLRCLGCSMFISTDRCHRFCRKCQRRNNRPTSSYELDRMPREEVE